MTIKLKSKISAKLFDLLSTDKKKFVNVKIQIVTQIVISLLFYSFCTVPVHLLQLLLEWSPGSPFGAFWFIFHWVQLILKLDADKVWSIDCLIYSHYVCTPWAVKLQNSNWGNTETLKTFSEHISLQCVPPPLSFMTFLCMCTKCVILDLVDKCFTNSRRGFWSHDISPDSVLHQTPIPHGLVVLPQ